MSKKVLVTKEFHREALRAIEFQRHHSDGEINDLLRQSWVSFINHKADDELLEEFAQYCQDYAEQLGINGKINEGLQ